MTKFALHTALALLLLLNVGAAADREPAAATSDTALNVVGKAGSRMVDVAEIEALGLRRLATRSPWVEGERVFDGVPLATFLDAVGLADSEAVMMRALDNYTQVIPRADWEEAGAFLATRLDGRPLTRRTQGPVQLVFPISDRPELDTPQRKPRWIWLIRSIEPARR